MPRIAKRTLVALLTLALAFIGWYLVKTSFQSPPLSVRILALQEDSTGVTFYYEIKNEADHPVCVTARYGVGKAVDPPINGFDIRDLQNSLPVVMSAGETRQGYGSLFKPAPPGTRCYFFYDWEPVWQHKVKYAWNWMRSGLKLYTRTGSAVVMPTPVRAPCELPPSSKEDFLRVQRMWQLSAQSTSKSHSPSPRR